MCTGKSSNVTWCKMPPVVFLATLLTPTYHSTFFCYLGCTLLFNQACRLRLHSMLLYLCST